jgi:hypothetical protein
MADDNNASAPQIPPKAVPPQVRPAGDAGAESPTVRSTPAPVPRTVRLKPISIPTAGAAPASPALPPVTPSAPVGTEEAAAAIKRMTARIAMMAEGEGEKRRTGQISVDAGAPKKATSSLAPVGIPVDPNAAKKMTTRIQMPSPTMPIPAVPIEVPKTIKIRPSGTQPVQNVEPAAVVGQTPGQQVAGKSKTSRIPLEQAMAVPQPAAAPEPAGGTPKTIKLKRPGEMTTIKVSVPQGPAIGGAGGAPAAAAGDADAGSPTQKKTIRVKRPMAPAAAPSAEGAASEAGGLSAAAISPLAAAPAAPERGTGWFVALAVACLLVGIGLSVVFGLQLFGKPPNTQLDAQFQNG